MKSNLIEALLFPAKKTGIIPVLLLLPGISAALFLNWKGGVRLTTTWPEALTDSISLIGGYLLLGAALRIYPTKVGLTGFALIAGFIVGLISAAGNIFLLKYLLQTTPGFPAKWLAITTGYRYIIISAAGIYAALMMATSRRVEELDNRFRRQQDAEGLLREAELLKLRQQLQPHFLFNSLNSIASLILISQEKAQEMIGQLAHFLRLSINRDGREALPVAAELEYIESYLAIEAIRFGDRLQIIFRKENLDGMCIPSHLLQPLIENAIKYGLQCEGSSVPVNIELIGSTHMLFIKLTNPCTPDALPSKGAGFGVESVRRRLYLLYGRTDLLETIAEKTSFTANLKIPQRHVSLPNNR